MNRILIVMLLTVGLTACGSTQPGTTVVHNHYHTAPPAEAPAARASARPASVATTADSVLDVLTTLLQGGLGDFKTFCASEPAGDFKYADGIWFCFQPAGFSIAVQYQSGTAQMAGFATTSNHARQLAEGLWELFGEPDQTGNGLAQWERAGATVSLKEEDGVGGVYVAKHGEATSKPACTNETTTKLDAHFKSKGWNTWHFSCVGGALHASYEAGIPGFSEAVLRADIEYLQDFYAGSIYVARHYNDRTIGVCAFVDGNIDCDAKKRN